MFHVEMFRQRMYNPLYTHKQLANALHVDKEAIIEEYGKLRKPHVNMERLDRRTGKAVTESLIDVRMLRDEDKFRLVRGYTLLLEDSYGPLLMSAADEINRLPEQFDRYDAHVLRTAAYRNAQFSYVYAACAALNLPNRLAACAVSLGFDMPMDTLAVVERDYRSLNRLRKAGKRDSFALLKLDDGLRFLALCMVLECVPEEERLPELDQDDEAAEREFLEVMSRMRGEK